MSRSTNNGSVVAGLGTLTIASLTNLSGTELQGGSYTATGGTLSLPTKFTTNAASLTIGITGVISSGGTNEISGLTSNMGSLTLSRNETASAPLANSGTVRLLAGTWEPTKFTQTAGTTTIAAGAILKAGASGTGPVIITAGLLTGNGEVSGAITSTGTVEPAEGSSPMSDSASFAQQSTGVFIIPIGGSATPGTDFGQLQVAGAAKVGGILAIVSAPGYLPAIGTTFTILTASSVTGTYSALSGNLFADRGYGVSYTSTAVILTVVPAPTITGIAPQAGPVAGGTVVTVSGTNLAGATVMFGSNPATGVTVNGAGTSLTATSPTGTVGTVDLTVSTAGGTSMTSPADRFTYVPAPTISASTPPRGPVGGGTVVTVMGTNLTGATVDFGAMPATHVTINGTGTALVATSPAEAAGTVDITATTAGGTSATSTADRFSYVGIPTITGVLPSAGPLSGGTEVTVTGTNLTGSTVNFGNAASLGGVTVNGAGTSLTATSPSGTGTVDVEATTAGGTSSVTAADQFTYVAAPAVSKVSPTSGPVAGGTVVTVTGTHLLGASVAFGAAAATHVTVNGAGTSLTASSPAGNGTVDVEATTAGGTSSGGAADQFTYVAAPTVSKVSPAFGPLAGGTVVTVTGTHLANAAVAFGAAAATHVTVNGAGTSLTATSPAGSGTVDVKATTAGGTSPATAADQFTYVVAPTVSKVSPAFGPLAGGTVVTVTGTHLANAAVAFGAVAATHVTVNGAGTSLTATSPAGSGTVDVEATTAGGTSSGSAADQFTYVAAPTVSKVSPAFGPLAGGTVVTVTGTHLANATVAFGAAAATHVTVNGAGTSLTATSPAGSGTLDVEATTAGGTSPATAADQFTYLGHPAVSAVSPSSGPVAGGTVVTVTGTNLLGETAVNFGSHAATNVSVNAGGTSLTATSPAGTGTVDITVANPIAVSVTSSAEQIHLRPADRVDRQSRSGRRHRHEHQDELPRLPVGPIPRHHHRPLRNCGRHRHGAERLHGHVGDPDLLPGPDDGLHPGDDRGRRGA